MKDEWEFDEDDDDEEIEEQKTRVSASPVKRSSTETSQASPANSSLSSSSRSRASSSSSKRATSADAARGRKQGAVSNSQASVASSEPSGEFRLRTRAARMKAKGIVKKSPNRRVRFDVSNSRASSDASSSTATLLSTNHGYRSFAESPALNNIRKQKSRKRMWDPENDGDVALQTKRKSEEKTKSPAAPVVRTASVDVYAIQDTVKIQRLADELRYCCDTLRSSRRAPQQLEAVADLSLLLSNRKNRQCLLFSHQQQGNDGGETSPLQILLQLMKWVHEKLGCSVVIAEPAAGQTAIGRTKTSRARPGKSSCLTPIVQEGLPSSVVEALGVVWHFLSMDCTMADESSSPTSTAARKLREILLSDRHAMQGLLEMVVSDPYLESVLTQKHVDVYAAAAGLSQESKSSLSSAPDSPASTGSLDPTVAGRWRKRQRKMLATASSLDAIPESNSALMHDEADTMSGDFWSYASESTNPKSRDDGSVASSQAGDAEIQLRKIFEKVKETVESPAISDHSCGNEKNELLSKLPLLSLCRVVSGKYDGDDRSCIDDDSDENPPDDDEDELSRNPLLRTNALLADSGTIPFIARATSNAAVAIMEQLTNRESCDRCETYLRWKFCKLTSLVDDACLLTDENRSTFSTEGFASETGGYLLINIATALKALLETEKLFDQTGWEEVAMAALRSLTSLTHDNEMAARDLQASTIKMRGRRSCNSLSVVVQVLYEASTHDGDMTIFCLNTLANILESGGSWHLFTKLTVGETKESFLKWLTKHVVDETKSFQDALVESSFGSSQDRHSERQLDKNENEALMMAGNAFILLAYILVRVSDKTSNKNRDEILNQLPGGHTATKLLFVKNTLKAFCNLYHYSVGALSLAIVAPVKKLLTDLEAVYGE